MSAAGQTTTFMGRLSNRAKFLLAVEVLVTYVRVRWLLWRTDLPSTLEALRRTRPGRRVVEPTDASLAGFKLASAVRRVLTPLPTDSRCLMRSLVLVALLARRHIDSTLVIGVKSTPDFAAHAWVEYSGRPLLAPGAAFSPVAIL